MACFVTNTYGTGIKYLCAFATLKKNRCVQHIEDYSHRFRFVQMHVFVVEGKQPQVVGQYLQ